MWFLNFSTATVRSAVVAAAVSTVVAAEEEEEEAYMVDLFCYN